MTMAIDKIPFLGVTGSSKIDPLISGATGVTRKPHSEGIGGTEGAISSINREVIPTYASNDSYYSTGLGHSKHEFMIMA